MCFWHEKYLLHGLLEQYNRPGVKQIHISLLQIPMGNDFSCSLKSCHNIFQGIIKFVFFHTLGLSISCIAKCVLCRSQSPREVLSRMLLVTWLPKCLYMSGSRRILLAETFQSPLILDKLAVTPETQFRISAYIRKGNCAECSVELLYGPNTPAGSS